MTNRPLVVKPGPKRLASALRLGGFSESVTLPAVTDACGVRWSSPSELQTALALVGGESSGNTAAFHVNKDGSTDFGALQVNDRAHAAWFGSQAVPAGWLWNDWIDNARAAYEIYVTARRKFTPWVAYTGGGWLAERYQGRSWLDWASFGCSQALTAIGAYVAQGKTESAAMALVASVSDDPLIYWQ